MSFPPRPVFRWPTSPQRLLASPRHGRDAPQKAETDSKNDILWSVLAYIFFPLPFLFRSKKDEFVMFHTRQSFGIFVASFVVYIVDLFGLHVLAVVLNLALLGIWCVGVGFVFFKKTQPIPVIGKISEKYKIF